MIERIYPDALDSGIDPFLFWNLSLGEISDLINSYQRTETRRQKQKAIDNSILADQIIRGIGAMFSEKEDDVEIKQVWDYYPGLFDKEKEIFEQQKEMEELERFKEKRRKFAINHNRMMGDDEQGQ